MAQVLVAVGTDGHLHKSDHETGRHGLLLLLEGWARFRALPGS
jgi:hypothetical protein